MRTLPENKFEWLVFENYQIAQARQAVQDGYQMVRIRTLCRDCGGEITCSLAAFEDADNHPIRHSDNLHQAFDL